MYVFIEALPVTFSFLENKSKHISGITLKIGLCTGLIEQELSIENDIDIVGVARQ